jgi:hypothetical protein
MNDKCDQLQSLFDEYAAGSLEASRKALVDEHIKTCPECRRKLAFSRLLARTVIDKETTGEGYHIDAKVLTDLAFEPESIDAATKEEVLRHIASCDECSDDLDSLRKAAVAPVPGLGGLRKQMGRRGPGAAWSWLTRPLAPVWLVMASAAVLVVIVTYGGWHRGPGLSELGSPGVSTGTQTPRLFELGSGRGGEFPERLLEESSELRRGFAQDVLSRLRPIPILLESEKHGADLVLDRDGSLAGLEVADVKLLRLTEDGFVSLASWDDVRVSTGTGPVLFQIPEGILGQGTYVLEVKPTASASHHAPQSTLFRLSVRIEPR